MERISAESLQAATMGEKSIEGKPFFSIIIPVYNVALYLRECLDSVLTQTFKAWECICVDDGSTDGSEAILDEYAAKDSRFRVVHQDNAGVSAARNRGLEEAKGEWVCFIDADDLISCRWLETARSVLCTVDIDLLRMKHTYWEGGESIPHVKDGFAYDLFADHNSVMAWGWETLLAQGWSWLMFFNRGRVLAAQDVRFPEHMRMREDNIFVLGALKYVNRAVQCDYPGYFYRQRSGSAINQAHTRQNQNLFRKHLKRLWHEAQPCLARSGNYENLFKLYRQHMQMRMYPEFRYSPLRIFRAIKRRLMA